MGKGLRLFPHAVTLLSFLEKLVNVDSTDIVIGYVRVSCGVDGAISSPSRFRDVFIQFTVGHQVSQNAFFNQGIMFRLLDCLLPDKADRFIVA